MNTLCSSPRDAVSATFAPRREAVSQARGFVRQALQGWGAEEVLDDALLLVSELVTNAVVHAGTQADVRCEVSPEGVRIDVVDRHGCGWFPEAGMPPVEAEGGRGMAMAAALAESWGVEYAGALKRVWVRLALPAGLALLRHEPEPV